MLLTGEYVAAHTEIQIVVQSGSQIDALHVGEESRFPA